MKLKFILFITLFSVAFVSCQDEMDVPRATTGVTIVYPDNVQALTILEETLVFTNVSTGENVTVPVNENFDLPKGLYNCSL